MGKSAAEKIEALLLKNAFRCISQPVLEKSYDALFRARQGKREERIRTKMKLSYLGAE